jgi:hypothetical protein
LIAGSLLGQRKRQRRQRADRAHLSRLARVRLQIVSSPCGLPDTMSVLSDSSASFIAAGPSNL